MGSTGLVRMSAIQAMLMACAPGHRIEPREHRHWVYYAGKVYRGLPMGKHGHRRNVEIEIGHVRSLVRFLGIDTKCARKHLEEL